VATIVLTVLGVVVGTGLLTLREGWRICAVAALYLGIVLLAVGVLAMGGRTGFRVTAIDNNGQVISDSVALAIVGGFAVLFGWMAWVLTRRTIRELFAQAAATGRDSSDFSRTRCGSLTPAAL
jgi:hypothetical protein